jgi:P27 family predicted phage terminase small subunit
MPGPKRMPSNITMLRGNPGHRALSDLTDDVRPDTELPGLPAHLLPEARKEWRRIADELLRYGLVSQLDRAALALYVQEWAWWVWHENALQADILEATTQRKAFDLVERQKVIDATARGEVYAPAKYTGADGFMLPTPNGGTTYNPHWCARNRHAAGLDKFLCSFGLSPASRGRVSPGPVQRDLFAEPSEGGWNSL